MQDRCFWVMVAFSFTEYGYFDVDLSKVILYIYIIKFIE
jgi:hypothetical protein